jgi:predicted GNAT family N-acyltransferase
VPSHLKIAKLEKAHERDGFACEEPSLTHYLQKQASQDMRRGMAACFVATQGDHVVLGYYTLSSHSLDMKEVPETLRKKLPHYPKAPVILLGRLARHISQKGTDLGEHLLLDALQRCHRVAMTEVGCLAVVVDPINEHAVRFYAKYGFITLPDSGRMFLPMNVIRQLFE